MTNPVNKRTHKEFIQLFELMNPELVNKVEFISEYTGVDHKIRYRCIHGEQQAISYSFTKKRKYCCPKEYTSNHIGKTLIVSSAERLDWYKSQRPELNFTDATLIPNTRNKFYNIKCSLHIGISFTGISTKQHCTPCPICKKENFKKLMALRKGVFHASHKITPVSKAEKRWLDSLNVPERQYWLPEVKYRVDGYDPNSNTVFLYHGRFWHGCPQTYDPEMIHPVVKIPMKDLYEKTLMYEDKIRDAGYNLIIEWGT